MIPFDEITCASIPAIYLDKLVTVRAQKNIKALQLDGTLWLIWSRHTQGIAELVYPLPGAEIYERRDQHWFAFRRQLPTFDVPDFSNARLLSDMLFPTPVKMPELPTLNRKPLHLALIADRTPRPATALQCKLIDLQDWLETVPTPRFSDLKAVRDDQVVLILGNDLPPIAHVQRYWGTRLLTPLGFRYEPFFSETTLLNTLDVASCHILLLNQTGMELIDLDRFQPLTRAAVRLALEEAN